MELQEFTFVFTYLKCNFSMKPKVRLLVRQISYKTENLLFNRSYNLSIGKEGSAYTIPEWLDNILVDGEEVDVHCDQDVVVADQGMISFNGKLYIQGVPKTRSLYVAFGQEM